MRRPESMDECVYFTNRDIGDKGSAMCWVFKEKCPECGRGLMGKPVGSNGKIKVRAKEYVCPDCGHKEPKTEYEENLIASIDYTCPECGHEGEMQVPFKRKRIKGVVTLRVKCESCNADIDITKKMKDA